MDDWLNDDASIPLHQTSYQHSDMLDETGFPDWLATALPPDLAMLAWQETSPVDYPSDLPQISPPPSAQANWPMEHQQNSPMQPLAPITDEQLLQPVSMPDPDTLDVRTLASTSSAPEPPKTGTAGKKRGNNAKDENKLPACDSCRIRRIKCLRDDTTGPCNPCKKKHVNCVLTPRPRKPYKNRGGRRVDMAIAACGGENVNSSSSSSSILEGPLTELESSFVDLFYGTLVLPSSIVRWRQLLRQLEDAGRNLTHMDETAAVLIKAIHIFGAMLSSRPEVLGDTDVPEVGSLEQYRGQDLSRYGLARQGILKKLHDDATKAFTSADMFRSQSAEASTAALFFNRLESYFEGSHSTRAARPYLNLAASIFRDLNGDVFNLVSRRVVFVAGWELLVEDAFWSAWQACEFAISDYMMSRIVHPFDISPASERSLDSFLQDVQSTDPQVFLKPLAFVWLGMVSLVRKTVQDVTLVVSRHDALPVATIHDILSKYERLLLISQNIANQIPPSISPSTLSRQKAAVSLHLDTQLQAVFVPLHHVLLILKKDIAAWQEKQRPEHPDYNQAYILQALIDRLSQRAAHEIAGQLRARPLQEALYDNSAVGRFLEFLPRWADIALDTPIEAGFSREQILANARTFIDAVMAQTFVWPSKAVEGHRLAEKYGRLLTASQ